MTVLALQLDFFAATLVKNDFRYFLKNSFKWLIRQKMTVGIPQDLIDRINSYFQRTAFQRNLLHWLLTNTMKAGSKLNLLSYNYGGLSPVSIKCHNLHSFNKGMILLCQSIIEMRRISHLYGSALFTIPLNEFKRINFCFL